MLYFLYVNDLYVNEFLEYKVYYSWVLFVFYFNVYYFCFVIYLKLLCGIISKNILFESGSFKSI